VVVGLRRQADGFTESAFDDAARVFPASFLRLARRSYRGRHLPRRSRSGRFARARRVVWKRTCRARALIFMSSSAFSGKTAVITGAGGTLCSAVAKELARRGAKVALLGRTVASLEGVAREIR